MATGIISFSDETYRLFGVSKETFGHSMPALMDLIHPDDRASMAKWTSNCVGEKNPNPLEFRIVPPDGRIRFISGSGGLHYDAMNKPCRMMGIAQDISERKLLCIAAKAFDTQDGILITDANNSIIEVNRAYSKITGYSRGEALGKNPNISSSGRHDMAFYKAMWEEINATGTWSGELWDKRKNGEVFPIFQTISVVKNPNGEVMNYVGSFNDITAQKRAEELIRYQANFDPLTGLPNRTLFFDRLSKALSRGRRSNKAVALLFLDLDGFKSVNDDYGHDAGDVVLKTVAQRWLSCVREADTVARLGGDEFTVILGDLESASDAAAIAEKLIQVLTQKIVLPDGRECRIGTSIGISMYPQNATEMDSLLSTADAAMYQSKLRNKNTYTFSAAAPFDGPRIEEWIEFNNSHLVGVYDIDWQHRELVQLVNQLNLAVKSGESEVEVRRLFNNLVELTWIHFDTELKLMQQYNYPEMAAHDAEHKRLLDTLTHLVAELHLGNELAALQAVKDWLMGHIQGSDKSLGEFLMSKGAF